VRKPTLSEPRHPDFYTCVSRALGNAQSDVAYAAAPALFFCPAPYGTLREPRFVVWIPPTRGPWR
jgi:hypothetical protein